MMNNEGCKEEVLKAVDIIVKKKGQNEFTIQEVVEQMRATGTTYEKSTIQTHVSSRMCANSPNHHGTTYHDIERVRRGYYKRR